MLPVVEDKGPSYPQQQQQQPNQGYLQYSQVRLPGYNICDYVLRIVQAGFEMMTVSGSACRQGCLRAVLLVPCVKAAAQLDLARHAQHVT
jgi:hypothetical protein